MRPDDVRRWLRHQPFQPFRICVVDGAVYEIRHPEIATVSRTVVRLTPPSPDGTEAQQVTEVALLHISRLERIIKGAS
jgi:hypothetical protein